ncbi:hypothetical protein CK934_11305 [Chitinophaga sp. MD30]|nr:hypothetical protein CK934_11305 [Chitinophaga sp. MD30]
MYITGMASKEDARELEVAMSLSPALTAEVEACRLDIERYIQLSAIHPPIRIKNNLLQRVSVS